MNNMGAPKGNKFALNNAGGRPTKLTAELLVRADEYLPWVEANPLPCEEVRAAGGEIIGQKFRPRLPSLDGLCVFLGISHRTLGRWLDDEQNKEFCGALSEVVELVQTAQSKVNIENSAAKVFDGGFGKLVQAQHGWREKTDITSDGKGLTVNVVNFSDAQKNSQIKV